MNFVGAGGIAGVQTSIASAPPALATGADAIDEDYAAASVRALRRAMSCAATTAWVIR